MRPSGFFNFALQLLIVAAVVDTSSCLVRSRTIRPAGVRPGSPVLTATKNDLIDRVKARADLLRSFHSKFDVSPSAGSLYAGEIKDYATIGAFILFQKPDSIRIVGLDPVAGSTIFDMVSLGKDFRIHLLHQKLLLEGSNDEAPKSNDPIRNLRPVAFLTSLIIEPPDLAADITLLEEDTTSQQSVYILLIISRRGVGEPWLARTIHFDRRDNLEIIRQKTFDGAGSVVSDTSYSSWQNYEGIRFPTVIDIKRPQERYEVILNLSRLRVNPSDFNAETFALHAPEGIEIRKLSTERRP